MGTRVAKEHKESGARQVSSRHLPGTCIQACAKPLGSHCTRGRNALRETRVHTKQAQCVSQRAVRCDKYSDELRRLCDNLFPKMFL